MRSHTHMLPIQMQIKRDAHGPHKHSHGLRGFSVLCLVFAQKQRILCSAFRLKCCLTLLYVTSIQDFFCPWTNRARLY